MYDYGSIRNRNRDANIRNRVGVSLGNVAKGPAFVQNVFVRGREYTGMTVTIN
jgi:hypothetical protein